MSNGVGPWWFPAFARSWLTKLSGLFFKEAAWSIHDDSYAAGYPSRYDCDRGFLAAMLRDASEASTPLKMAGCCVLAWTFWGFTRAFGWISYQK